MVVQTNERRWVYTDPVYPHSEVHISKHVANPSWFCVFFHSGRILGHDSDNLLDALAIAATWIGSKEAET